MWDLCQGYLEGESSCWYRYSCVRTSVLLPMVTCCTCQDWHIISRLLIFDSLAPLRPPISYMEATANSMVIELSCISRSSPTTRFDMISRYQSNSTVPAYPWYITLHAMPRNRGRLDPTSVLLSLFPSVVLLAECCSEWFWVWVWYYAETLASMYIISRGNLTNAQKEDTSSLSSLLLRAVLCIAVNLVSLHVPRNGIRR